MHALLFLPLLLCADPSPEQLKLLTTFRDEFVQITPGEGKFPASFEMGSAKSGEKTQQPAHKVTLKHKFAIGKYEVPQNLWEAVMGENPSRWKGPRNSVEMLTHDDAVTFCEKVTELLRAAKLIDAKQRVRLPTEAEWEYCCRAGTTSVYSFGDDAKALGEYAWFTGNAAGNDPPVGAKKPNAWGLYDLHGYLWEWCADTWHDDYTHAPTDGSAWIEKKSGVMPDRVVRGGSWQDTADECTSTFRQRFKADTRDPGLGLRCVLE